MRPESFPTDDDLGRNIQRASAPLPANDGTPYEAVFGDVSKIIDAARESAARSVNTAMTEFARHRLANRLDSLDDAGEDARCVVFEP